MNAMTEAKTLLSEHDRERARLDRIQQLVRRIETITGMTAHRAQFAQSSGMQITLEIWGGSRFCINLDSSEVALRQELDRFMQAIVSADMTELTHCVGEYKGVTP